MLPAEAPLQTLLNAIPAETETGGMTVTKLLALDEQPFASVPVAV
jgi:hypothetical protein